MKIALDLIKPSPHSIRTSWDEKKLEELAQSIREQGLIVPVKVRPMGNEYEIVYGHRRTEAARRAGLIEIEPIVEGLDDINARIQALIENVQREDLSVDDRADAIYDLLDLTNWSQMELQRRGIMSQSSTSQLLAYRSEREAGAVPININRATTRDQGWVQTLEIKKAFDDAGEDSVDLRRRVAEKTIGVPHKTIRQYASLVASTKDPVKRQAILDTPADDPSFERVAQTKTAIRRKQLQRENKKRQENPREVAEYIEAVQAFSGAVQVAIKVAEYGKFSPEAGRFLVGWHNSIREGLDQLEKIWEERNA